MAPVEHFRSKEAERKGLYGQPLTPTTKYYALFAENPTAYYAWLSKEIASDSERFSKFRRYPSGTFPISWRRRDLYARLVKLIHGSRCVVCGFEGRLEHAHLAYFSNSVPARELKRSASLMRMIEAIKHPDRIIRLCSLCHDIFDYSRKNGGRYYLNRMEKLITLSEEKEVEAYASGAFQGSRSLSA